jgi:acetyl-CoA carboxylase biotin carboxyl carrier protein
MLSFKEIKELIGLVAENRLAGLEIERAGFRIRIEGQKPEPSSNGGGPVYFPSIHSAPVQMGSSLLELSPPASAGAVPREPEPVAENLHVIVSPIVGTFYRSASPESPPFVSPGDKVQKNKILCIIEAMKLMNEIESDVSGEVVEVYPQNGQPVEYGEKLFAIRIA